MYSERGRHDKSWQVKEALPHFKEIQKIAEIAETVSYCPEKIEKQTTIKVSSLLLQYKYFILPHENLYHCSIWNQVYRGLCIKQSAPKGAY